MKHSKRDYRKVAMYMFIELEIAGYQVALEHLEKNPCDIKLADRIILMEEAIEEFCDFPAKLEYLQLKFWGPRIGNKEIGHRLGISNAKVLKWRERFLDIAGEKLGLI